MIASSSSRRRGQLLRLAAMTCCWLAVAGCLSADRASQKTERRAFRSIDGLRAAQLDAAEPFALPPAETEWRKEWGLPLPHDPRDDGVGADSGWRAATNRLYLSPLGALQVAARGNVVYQDLKDAVFRAALTLEKEEAAFRNTFETALRAQFSGEEGDESTRGTRTSLELGLTRNLPGGAAVKTALALDLARLLTADRDSSFGAMADVSVSIPLLQNAGETVVLEPLRQAERDLVYAVYELEHHKKQLAVRVATQYFAALQASDQRENTLRNYRALTESRRRVERLADAGRMSGIQVDQARQDELSAREQWMRAGYRAEAALDSFKLFLGLPPEVWLSLDEETLARLAASIDASTVLINTLGTNAVDGASLFARAEGVMLPAATTNSPQPRKVTPDDAVMLALANRLDRRTARARIEDARRKLDVAAAGLRGGLDVSVSLQAGERRTVASAARDDASLDLDESSYEMNVEWKPPWERTAESAAYRRARVEHARSIRQYREAEHAIIKQVRDAYRSVLQALESCRIQSEAVRLAERRVASTELFLAAGRIHVRDVLEARDSLLAAQNALTAARIDYSVALLELQRDVGLLSVTDKGICIQYESQAN